MDFKIENLGKCTIQSPLVGSGLNSGTFFVNDNNRILYDVIENEKNNSGKKHSFEIAGPREKIFFDPKKVRCAIVTCGGLCPGLNDVIRSIVMESWYFYGIRNILGIRYGYNGLREDKGYAPIELNPEVVRGIHMDGGTMLGSSRGGTEDLNLQLDMIQKLNIDILYTIGGDGTLKGAHEISELADKRGIKLSVIGIPKTIDNDISFIERSFGFVTATAVAVQAINSAHVEAHGAPNCIGLVKLMGRQSGFIAAHAAIANNDVNFVLIPESKFDLYGENGFLAHLEKRILNRQHAVVCVAEGAGQDVVSEVIDSANTVKDASGNIKFNDIGLFLKDEIKKYFKKKNIELNLKYIDPSYIIRSAPAVPQDSIYCSALGQYAVHAGMAGKTDMIVGLWNNMYTHVPIDLAVSKRKKVDIESRFWYNVISATGQPFNMKN